MAPTLLPSRGLCLLIVLFNLLFSGLIYGQTNTWDGSSDTNWNTAANWSLNAVPNAAHDVVINSNAAVAVDVNATINTLTIANNAIVSFTSSGGARTITIDNNGSTITAGSTLALNGSVGSGTRSMNIAFSGASRTMAIMGTLNVTAVGEGSVYIASNSITNVTGLIINSGGNFTSAASNLLFAAGATYRHVNDGGTIPTAGWNVASNCEITGWLIATTGPSGLSQNFGNFSWNSGSQTADVSLGGNLNTVNGNFAVSNTGTGAVILGSGNGDLTIAGNFSQTAGEFIGSSSNSRNININGNFAVSGGLFNLSQSGNNSNAVRVFVKKNYIHTAGTITETGSTTGSGITFNGTTLQTFTPGGTLANMVNYVINSGAAVDFASAVISSTSTGSFTLNSGGKIITANSAGLTSTGATGTVQSSGTRTYNSGASYEFQGANTGAFVLSTPNKVTGTLTFNRAAGVTANQSFTAATLALTNGIITTGTNSLTVELGGTLTGGSATAYVNGQLRRTFSATGNLVFPVGKAGNYRPFGLQVLSLSGTCTFAVEQNESALVGILPGSINLNNTRTWDVSQSGAVAGSYKVVLDGTGDAVSGNVVMLRKEDGTITAHPVTSPNYSLATALTTLNNINNFTLGSTCAATANAGADQTTVATCGLTTVNLTGNTPTYGSGLWSVVSGIGGSFGNAASPVSTFTGIAGAAYNLQWTVTNGNCTANDQVLVTFNRNPTIAINNATQSLCAGSSTVLSANTPTVGTAAWSVVSGPSTLTSQFSSLTNPLATFTPIGGPGTYIVRWTISNMPCGTSTADATITMGTTKTWNGSAWSPSAPSSIDAAVISGNFNAAANGNMTACSLTVSNNAAVLINTGYTVTLNRELNVISGSFTLENNANLIQSANVANSGNIIVKRNSSPLLRQDYTLWSAPVAGQNLGSFSPLTVATRFYNYNTTTNVFVATAVANNFASAKSCLIRMPNNTSAVTPTIYPGVFSGVPNNGDYPVAMTNGGGTQIYNLVGNPYPSPISMSAFVSDNAASITGTLYFWRETNSTTANNAYCAWAGGTFVSNGEAQVVNPSGIIQTGQGFFVAAKPSQTALIFKNSQRVNNHSNQFFRKAEQEERHTVWLNVTNVAGAFAQMAVGYITDATTEVDLFDGRSFAAGDLSLNSILEGHDYVIQGRSLPFMVSDVVPLRFKTATAGNYTIAIDHLIGLFEGSQNVFIKDNLANLTHDLKAAAFNFTTEAGVFSDRFELVYESPLASAAQQTTSTEIVIYKQQQHIIINSGREMMNHIEIYDSRGRLLVHSEQIHATELRLMAGSSQELWLVKITTEDGRAIVKKVLN